MGGRGGKSSAALSEKQYERLEDIAQKNDAVQNGFRLRARYYEYTDRNGKVHKGETGADTPGGVYRSEYSKQVAVYSRESTQALERERESWKSISDEQYQRFARSAASRGASQARTFAEADTRIKMIDQILKRRRRNKR